MTPCEFALKVYDSGFSLGFSLSLPRPPFHPQTFVIVFALSCLMELSSPCHASYLHQLPHFPPLLSPDSPFACTTGQLLIKPQSMKSHFLLFCCSCLCYLAAPIGVQFFSVWWHHNLFPNIYPSNISWICLPVLPDGPLMNYKPVC